MCIGGFSYDGRLESEFARRPESLSSKEILDLQLFRIARYYEAEGRRVRGWGDYTNQHRPEPGEHLDRQIRRLQIRRATRDEMRESVTEELLWRRTTT